MFYFKYAILEIVKTTDAIKTINIKHEDTENIFEKETNAKQ